MKITEIFAGVEGEGSRVGQPQIFVRTQGCKINCTWCDVKHTWKHDEKKGVKVLSPTELIIVLSKNEYNLGHVSLTGGNPMEQLDIRDVVDILLKNKYTVSMEVTGQDYDDYIFRKINFISCDIKTPSSGVEANMDIIKKIAKKYDFKSQFKAVVSDDKDLDFAINAYKELVGMKHTDIMFILTPCWEPKTKEPDRKMITKMQKRIFEENLPIRMVLQQHKVLWGPDTQGV